MDAAIFHPLCDIRVNVCDEAAFSAAVVAVDEERPVTCARPVAELDAGFDSVGQLR